MRLNTTISYIMDIKIERAIVDDLNDILILQKECFQSEAIANKDFEIPPLHQDLESLQEEFNKGIILKATANNQIIGSVRGCQYDNTAYVGKLIVDPNFQNKGLGKQLMDKMEEEFKLVERIEIFTGAQSEKNLNFYNKIGFVEFKQQKINENLTLVFLEKIR